MNAIDKLYNMGSQLRWLERMPDKHEVDGSIPFEPTKAVNKTAQNNNKIVVENYKQVV